MFRNPPVLDWQGSVSGLSLSHWGCDIMAPVEGSKNLLRAWRTIVGFSFQGVVLCFQPNEGISTLPTTGITVSKAEAVSYQEVVEAVCT